MWVLGSLCGREQKNMLPKYFCIGELSNRNGELCFESKPN